MILNEIFAEFLDLLNTKEVKYVLVGGWAVIFHGYTRTTGDMDILVKPEIENAKKLLVVLKDFFGSTIGFTEEDFVKEDNVLMMGRVPFRIDILTSISGITFEEVFASSHIYEDEDLKVRCIHINALIQNKESTGRLKDLADADKLKKILKYKTS
jgi:hypothetical protein